MPVKIKIINQEQKCFTSFFCLELNHDTITNILKSTDDGLISYAKDKLLKMADELFSVIIKNEEYCFLGSIIFHINNLPAIRFYTRFKPNNINLISKNIVVKDENDLEEKPKIQKNNKIHKFFYFLGIPLVAYGISRIWSK